MGTARRTPQRALRFAIRCGDRELADLLGRALAREEVAVRAALVERTVARIAAKLGIS